MRGLVVLRCGQNSLHWDWLDARRENWDLLLCPYQEIDAPGYEAQVIPGQKWDGLAQFFAKTAQWRDYDYICLPDDDIATTAATLNALFSACDKLKTDLVAPALTPNSHFSHPITMLNTEFAARRTSFVEIMMPCFSRAFFQEALPTFNLSRSGTGFGLDYLWPYMLSYEGVWIFDELAVHHTRPVGAMRQDRLAALANADLQFIHGFGIPAVHKTLGGIGQGGVFLRYDEPGFAERYKRGYAYLGNRMADLSRYIDLELATGMPSTIGTNRDHIRFALQHLAEPDRTLSRGRPSRTSSTSQWSWSADPALEASGANDGLLNGCCGFHTRCEANPWWQVDLGAPHGIESVVIYNRLDQNLRCVDFDILVSDDAESWAVAYAKRDGVAFGGADGNPFRHDFVPPVAGRFLRVRLVGVDFLHLDQVEVFGVPGEGVRPVIGAAPTVRAPRIIGELLAELYGGGNPFAYGDPKNRDDGYPHTNLIPDVIDSILDMFRPTFWLEIGSMLGGSAIRTAELIKRRGLETGLVCIDPFCGDVNMWAWEQPKRRAGEWLFLGLRDGRPTIFDRFIANVVAAGHADITLPITATSIVGTKLLTRLMSEGRITSLPNVIYLDSAHEPDETFLELRNCWNLLPSGGVLMGDDWSWNAVREDVLRFAKTVALNEPLGARLEQRHGRFTRQEGVLLDRGQWVLVK
jgi:F5/8 type C domain/Methyltransferase domain